MFIFVYRYLLYIFYWLLFDKYWNPAHNSACASFIWLTCPSVMFGGGESQSSVLKGNRHIMACIVALFHFLVEVFSPNGPLNGNHSG